VPDALLAVLFVVAAFAQLIALHALSPAVGLIALLVVLVPYVSMHAIRDAVGRRGRLAGVARWLRSAIAEEEAELEIAIRPRPATNRDYLEATLALVVVLGAVAGRPP
jgi:hypothetical protein